MEDVEDEWLLWWCGVLELREEVQLPDCLDIDAPIREEAWRRHPRCLRGLGSLLWLVSCHQLNIHINYIHTKKSESFNFCKAGCRR